MNIAIALFPLVMLIAMGYVLKRTQFIQDGFWGNSEKLNYFILFPILLFINLSTVQFNLSVMVYLLTALCITMLIISGILWVVKFFYHIPVARFGVYVQSHIRFNTYIGLSLIATLFGSKGMQLFAMLIAIAIPLANILSVMAFSRGEHNQPVQTILSIIKNPLILGCVIGILFNVSGMHLNEGMHELLKILASMSLPLGLISVGAALQFAQLKQDCIKLSMNIFGRLLLVPSLAFFVCSLMKMPVLESAILVTFFSLPTASAAYILTRYFQGDSQLMAGVISVQTLCFMISYPLLMSIFYSGFSL